MQLTIDVLPAPFGPMMENSSPSRIEKLTSASALTPPNNSVTCAASRRGAMVEGCKLGRSEVISAPYPTRSWKSRRRESRDTS